MAQRQALRSARELEIATGARVIKPHLSAWRATQLLPIFTSERLTAAQAIREALLPGADLRREPRRHS
jgi:hypothetical protein